MKLVLLSMHGTIICSLHFPLLLPFLFLLLCGYIVYLYCVCIYFTVHFERLKKSVAEEYFQEWNYQQYEINIKTKTQHKPNLTHLLHDAVEGFSVAAVDESISDHSATLMVEESREELRALTHLRRHSQDPLKYDMTHIVTCSSNATHTGTCSNN